MHRLRKKKGPAEAGPLHRVFAERGLSAVGQFGTRKIVPPCGAHRARRGCADDDYGVGSEARKLCRKLLVGLRLTEHEPGFDCKILTFDIAKVAKPSGAC